MPLQKPASPDTILQAIRPSLAKIDQISPKGKEYIDLFLLHAPSGGEEGRANGWEALKTAQKEGWIKDIGVSN
jgi:diketogulonate reductase-like aldo/keto reductase